MNLKYQANLNDEFLSEERERPMKIPLSYSRPVQVPVAFVGLLRSVWYLKDYDTRDEKLSPLNPMS